MGLDDDQGTGDAQATKGKPKRRRGRPSKGGEVGEKPGRLARRSNGMSIEEMLDDLLNACDHGTKRNGKV